MTNAPNHERDRQCERTLDAMHRIRKWLERDFTQDLLGLREDNSPASDVNKQVAALDRLVRSLEQYQRTSNALIYVGFMGHFSSGKSSTINSLLNLNDQSDDARATGLHPTDTSITLITHQTNKSRILDMACEGPVPVRVAYHDHDLLRNVVLIDTPGSGDPKLMSEIVRDFLPVCDLLLYFVNPTSPLDNADLPLLKLKNEFLRFIPTRIVVSRADEFRSDKNSPLAETNFAHDAANVFVHKLHSRVVEIFGNDVFERSEVFVVDNVVKFGINKLGDYIVSQWSLENSNHIKTIHSNKIEYFRLATERVRGFFANYTQDKVEKSRATLAGSRTNVVKWDDCVQITNSRQTERWRKHASLIESTFQIIYDALKPISLPRSFGDISLVAKWKKGLATAINKESEEFVIRVVNSVSNILRIQFDNCIKATKEQVLATSSIEAVAEVGLPSRIHFGENDAPRSEEPPVSLLEEFRKRANVLDQALESCQSPVAEALDKLIAIAQKGDPIAAVTQIINTANYELRDDIERYFTQVEVYVHAVMAGGLKELTERLKLGAKLDAITQAFAASDEKDAFNRDAVRRAFPDFARTVANFKQRADHIHGEALALRETLQRDIQLLPIECPENFASVYKSTHSLIARTVTNRIGERWHRSEREGTARIREFVAHAKKLREEQRAELHRRWFRSCVTYASCAMIIGGLVALLGSSQVAKWLEYQNPPTIGWSLSLGALGGVPTAVFGWVLSNAQFAYPKKEMERIRQNAADLKREIVLVIQDASENMWKTQELCGELLPVVRDQWEAVLKSCRTDTVAKEYDVRFGVLVEVSGKYMHILSELIPQLKEFECHVEKYFTNSEENLTKLGEIASRVKSLSIEPHATLIETYHRNLESSEKDLNDILI